jgi:hypothetical protein
MPGVVIVANAPTAFGHALVKVAAPSSATTALPSP